jgi:hypothetical protein
MIISIGQRKPKGYHGKIRVARKNQSCATVSANSHFMEVFFQEQFEINRSLKIKQ